MTEDSKRKNIRDEVDKAERELAQARLLKEAGHFDGCAGKAYYCAFHYARALILTLGVEAKSHAGVNHLVNQHFVHTGRLSPETAKNLRWLQAGREESDYEVYAIFTDPVAEKSLAWAEEYRRAIRDLLTRDGYLSAP